MSGQRRYHALPPKVTGLSPKEGLPGTKVTIRGENLGSSPEDLIGLSICGQDCLIYSEWITPSKILTRSQRCKGIGDVIVTTRSGGLGTCTVQFRGFEEVITLTKESAVWVNEDDIMSVASTTTRHRTASTPSLMLPDPLGLQGNHDEEEEDETGTSVASSTTSSLITSDQFCPALFLLTKHRKATFKELKAGLQHLKKSCGEERSDIMDSTSPLVLLKPNVLAVVECLDALKSVHHSLKKDRQEFGADLTVKIEDIVKKCGDEAQDIFSAILAKKDTSDSTRNALNVLQRYRFLFNLPSSIERNIQRGDYDVVINDYARARALFDKTEVKVFRKVFGEVEQRVKRLKDVLKQKLKDGCSLSEGRSVDELKKLIRLLMNLGVEGNPAWESITLMKDVLHTNMTKCRDKHLTAAVLRSKEDTVSADPPQTVLFAEELVEIFNHFYPDLVKLGHEYLSGNLYSKDSDETLKLKELTFDKDMIQELVRLLVTLLRSALLPTPILGKGDPKSWPAEKCEGMAVWLPHCLRTMIDCHQSLLRQESVIAVNTVQPVQQLIFDFRVHSVSFLFNQVAQEVKSMYLRENWDVTLDNSLGARTQLPLLFESKVIEILQLLRETILQTSSADEVDIFTQINVQGQMKQLAQNLMHSFKLALEQTLSGDIPAQPKAVFSADEHVLIVMCNCAFTMNHVFPRLQENFDKYNYPDMSLVMKVSQQKFKELELKLLKDYIERKKNFVIGDIEGSMYCLNYDWYCPPNRPTDVSFYIKETLMNVIRVQAEVFAITPSLVKKILVEVIDAAIEEVSRLHECVAQRFNEYGNLQAVLDFAVLKVSFRDIESESTEKLFESSCHHLRPVRSPDRESFERTLNQVKQSMHLQLYCFKWESDQSVIVI